MGGSGYLHSEENRKILDRTIPIGKYEVELAILNSKTISKRVVGAKLKIKMIRLFVMNKLKTSLVASMVLELMLD